MDGDTIGDGGSEPEQPKHYGELSAEASDHVGWPGIWKRAKTMCGLEWAPQLGNGDSQGPQRDMSEEVFRLGHLLIVHPKRFDLVTCAECRRQLEAVGRLSADE